jgi:hypothetical protein
MLAGWCSAHYVQRRAQDSCLDSQHSHHPEPCRGLRKRGPAGYYALLRTQGCRACPELRSRCCQRRDPGQDHRAAADVQEGTWWWQHGRRWTAIPCELARSAYALPRFDEEREYSLYGTFRRPFHTDLLLSSACANPPRSPPTFAPQLCASFPPFPFPC